MAKLILTKKEKKADSYLEWSDKAIGVLGRHLTHMVLKEKGTEKEEHNALFLTTCLVVFGSVMKRTNAANMRLRSVFSGPKLEGYELEIKATLRKVKANG